MKKKTALFVTLVMAFSVCMASLGNVFAAAGDTFNIGFASTGGSTITDVGGDFRITVTNMESTSIILNVQKSSLATQFGDFTEKIWVKRNGAADYVKLNTIGGVSIHLWGTGAYNVHSLSLKAGELIKFEAGFRPVYSVTAGDQMRDATAADLAYSAVAPLAEDKVFERDAAGLKFLAVGDNPTGLTVAVKSYSLVAGDTQKIDAVTVPAAATNNTLTYQSSDGNVATVAADGTITAVGAGSATITVKTVNDITETVSVTVTAGTVEATGVSFENAEVTMEIATVKTLVATVAPADTTDKTVTFTSSNEAVAVINAGGKVLAKTSGTTTITAKTHNNKTATCTLTVSADNQDIRVASFEANIGKANDNSKVFVFNFPAGAIQKGQNTTNLKNANGIKDKFLINGTAVSATKYDVHLLSGDLYVYNYLPSEGDTLEILAGFSFPVKCTDPDYSSVSLYKDAIGASYKIIYLSGTWTKVADAGSVNSVTGFGRLSEKAATDMDVARYSFNMSTEIALVNASVGNLQTKDNYKNNLYINGVSVADLNTKYKAVHAEEGDLPAVTLSANGSTLTVNIAKAVKEGDKDAEIINSEDSFSFKLSGDFVSDTGMIHDADVTRYYLPQLGYWSTIEPYEITKTDGVYASAAVHKKEGNDYRITVTFSKNISSKSLLGYGMHPGYLASDNVPAGTYGAKAYVNELASSGAMDSLFNNLLINGKSIYQYWKDEELTSDQQKSERFQLHIEGTNRIIIQTGPTSELNEANDVVIVFKAGLVFYEGAYLETDCTVTYSGTTDKKTVLSYDVAVALSADKTTLNVGEEATLTAETTPSVSIPATYESDNESVATVDENGKITAVGKGTAVITATVGGATDTVTVTVKLPASGVTVDKDAVTLDIGGTHTIVATASPEGTTDVISYSSDNESVATVGTDGKITAVSQGTATITVTCGDKTATVTVTVNAAGGNNGGGTDDSGCKSMSSTLGTSGALIAITLLAGAATVALRKRKDGETK